jgi:hypothetical protein
MKEVVKKCVMQKNIAISTMVSMNKQECISEKNAMPPH